MNAEKMNALAQMVTRVCPGLTFTIMEIGALPLGGRMESFHRFVDLFPGSRIVAFELDEELCRKLNRETHEGITYYPVALGRTEEGRLLFVTNEQMCCSLYKPQEELLRQYNGLEVALLKSVSSVETVSLDHFLGTVGIRDVDFIKIDIQGAELDVFKGGADALKNVVTIVTEVEFIPLYYKQPLFGDVSSYLTAQGFMFHKFREMAGSTLKPVTIGDNPFHASQHMWTDAVFIRDIMALESLAPEKLLKMAVLAYLYDSPDVAYRCFTVFDGRNRTSLCQQLITL